MEELAEAEIEELLSSHFVARIGCHTDDLTYVVPIIYAYDGEAAYVLSVEGQKVQMMRANPRVCFEVDEYERGSWRSVIAQGEFEELSGAEVERAVELLRARFPQRVAAPRRELSEQTVAFRIRLGERTGRAVRR